MAAAGLVFDADTSSNYNCGIVFSEGLIDSIEASSFTMDISRLYTVMPGTSQYCLESGRDEDCYESLRDFMSGFSSQALSSDNVQTMLRDGPHLLFHFEHSNRDVLGGVAGRIEDDVTCLGDASFAEQCLSDLQACNAVKDHYTSDMADHLDNGPDLPIIFSSGCDTNWYDLDSISERFIRAPSGGAIAYIGGEHSVRLEGRYLPARLFHRMFIQEDRHLGVALRNAVNERGRPATPGILFPLLGDPELPLSWAAPRPLSLAKSPASLSYIGPNTITITVTDSVSSSAVEGARVCLKQGQNDYAIGWTNASGEAEFEAFSPTNSDTTWIVATATGYYPKRDFLTVPSGRTWYYVAYDGHTRDDDVTGGDGDDVLEAGETVELSITAKNESPAGLSDRRDVWAKLWATAPITCELEMTGAGDEDYEPEDIYIGKKGAHPHPSVESGGLTAPGWGNEFRIPGNWEGIRTEEPYQGGGIPSESMIYLWRATDGSYKIRTYCHAGDDSTFTGTFTTEGGFSNVSKTGESADSLFFDAGTDPNTLGFKFVGDATDDYLSFDADAPDWIDISPDSSYIGTLASGSTASVDFTVALGEEIPDENELVFTLAVRDTTNSWWASDFSETCRAPLVRQVFQRTQCVESGIYDSLYVWPTVLNVGQAEADSVLMIIRESSGLIWRDVDTLRIGGLEPGGEAEADSPFKFFTQSNDTTVFYANDILEIEVRAFVPNGEYVTWSRDRMDISPPGAVRDLLLDEAGDGAKLRWTEPSTDAADLEGYHAYRYLPSDSARLTGAPSVGSSRYDVTGLDTFDAGNDYIGYRFAVTPVDSSGNEGPEMVTGVGHLWIPEHSHWPKFVDSRSQCAPVACDVTGDGKLEIFAAGKAIYAWKASGDPLIEGNDDGLFYDPVEDADASADFDDENCLFVGDLAVGDLDGDNNYEVVGNLAPYGIYVIEYDHSPTPTVTKEWFREAEDAWHCAPSLADLDSSGTSEVILSGGDKPRLYVWECDGRTFQRTIDSLGVYGSVASGAKYNFGHVAVGEFDPRSDGLEIIQSLGDVDSGGNCAPSVTCWSMADSTGSQLWTTAIGGAYYLTLSTPVIGDIDASDEALEIVVSRQAHDDAAYQKGGLWMLNDAGGIVQYVEHDDLFLRVEPPPVPALGELGDGDDALEVFLADGREGDNDGDWSALLPLYLWEPDSSAAVDTTTVSDRLPIPGRKHQHSIGQYQPVIADLDGDDSLEVVVSNNSGYLGCFGMTSGDTLKAEAGWPQRFGDIPLTPLVADVNADGDLDLVVVDRSGTVHLLKLPGEAAGASLPWPQFGHDAGNTSNYHGLSRGRGNPATGDEPGLVADRLLMVGPTLLQEQVGIRFSLPRAEEVDLRVLDLQGRVVCTLLSGLQPAGEHTVHWDGRSQSGARLTNGVYFIRLVRPDRMETRRVAVIH